MPYTWLLAGALHPLDTVVYAVGELLIKVRVMSPRLNLPPVGTDQLVPDRTWTPAYVCGPAVTVAVLVGISGQASAQTVANGSFSTTANNQTATYTLSNGATNGNNYLPSWTLNLAGSQNCLIASDTFAPPCTPGPVPTGAQNPGYSPSGGNFIDLSSTSYISQSITLTAGQKYTVSFQEAGTDPGGTGTASVDWVVTVGSVTAVTAAQSTETYNPSSYATWTTVSETFTAAASGSQTLTLTASTNSTGGQSPVALLDGVSLAAVATPEPATLTVFGAGLAALMAVRRRRK